jgi:YegS/Rv2252/BmrU family lipid kinase
MTHVMGRLRLIVNPEAGKGAVAATLAGLRKALDEHGLDHDVTETTGPGDATRAARQALEDGCLYLVAVGGDGTVHEVVNGMFDGDEPVSPRAILGVVSAGSGCDFVRTFGLNIPVERLVRHLATETIQPIDVGKVTYLDADGNHAQRLFANIGEVGYGAECVRRAARYPRRMGRFRYLFAAYGAIRAMERPETRVTLAHTEISREVVNVVAANAQFFGGGMKVAPRALPDDGRFNVQVFTGPRSQVFTLTQKIYRGEHLPNPQISEYQSPTLEVDPATPLPVEADGEYLGTTPATFSLLDKALRLKI